MRRGQPPAGLDSNHAGEYSGLVVSKELKQLVRLRPRGRRKSKGFIKKDNSLHVNAHLNRSCTS